MSEQDVFWSLVDKTGDCWIWQGGRGSGRKGYGWFRVTAAHRYAWMICRGEIGDNWVLHKCDNKLCVNPDHLYLGTVKDNARDAVERGQHPFGDRNGSRTRPDRLARGDKNGTRKYPERVCRGSAQGSAKLVEADIPTIRELYAEGKTQRDIAKLFGVSHRTILRVLQRETWHHV